VVFNKQQRQQQQQQQQQQQKSVIRRIVRNMQESASMRVARPYGELLQSLFYQK